MNRRAGQVLLVGVVLASTLLSGAGCGSSSPGGGSSQPSATVASSPAGSAGGGSASGGSAGGGSATAGAVTVQVQNFAFTPQTVTVPVGGTVTWKFDDSAEHTATALDKSFNSPPLSSGKTFQHTFTKAGTYAYMCSIHQFMTGTVIVK